MVLKEIYTQMAAENAEGLSQVSFVAVCNSFTSFLVNKYGESYVLNSDNQEAVSINDDIPVIPFYKEAYVDYISGAMLGKEGKVNDALTRADDVYKRIWRKRAKNKHIRKDVWY